MSSEKSTYGRFRGKLLTRFNRINRVENLIVPGMPDVNCCFKGKGEFWIEIKTPNEPVRPTTPLMRSNHKLGREQINWHLHQWQCGGKSYILVDTDKNLMLVSGAESETFNDLTVDEMIEVSLYHSKKPMRRKQWKELNEILG